jgi:hypothetical protein
MKESIQDPPEFTDDELRAVLKTVGENARRKAFAAGHSVMIARGGKLVQLHPDGTEEVVGPLDGETTTRK